MKHLDFAKSKGYEISLTFLWLMSPEQAVKRVIQRVKQGGHYVPEESVMRRYHAGLKNLLKHYLPLADSALIIDNSPEELLRKPIARKNINGSLKILNKDIWEKIKRTARE